MSTGSYSNAVQKRRPLYKAAPTPRKDRSMILDPSSLHHRPPETLIVLFKIISRRSWDELHRWHEALPGSHVEHVLYGIYALIIPQGGAKEIAE
jgi:hypothetical protein